MMLTKKQIFTTTLLSLIAISFIGCSQGNETSTAQPSPDSSPSNPADVTESEPVAGTADPTLYAYSMLAPGTDGTTQIYARVAIDSPDYPCPALIGDDGSSVQTSVRPFIAVGTSDSSKFDVTLCEALIPEAVGYSVSLTSKGDSANLTGVTLDPERVLIYGDSGCETSDCPGTEASTQFLALADVGAGENPQLILHMGDYNYRGTSGAITGSTYAYDAGDGGFDGSTCGLKDTYYSQSANDSPRPDTWQNWKADFFDAANPVLGKAPWVFARGNHELCSRAGVGWFYFLGPGSTLDNAAMTQMQCPDQGYIASTSVPPPAEAKGHIMMIPPYMLSLNRLDLWVVDSANACDELATNELRTQYSAQFDELQKLAAANPKQPIWMMTHRPIWGYQKKSELPPNQMLQAALKKSTMGKLPDSLTLSLSGHMHVYESLTFLDNSDRPPQVIVGNSGVKLGGHPKHKQFTETVDGETASGNSITSKFGFLSTQVNASGAWTGTMLGTDSSTLLTCDSSNPAKGTNICTLP